MPNLSIPEAVAENYSISAAAKLAYAEVFSRLKKGERPSTQLNDIGISIALGSDDLIPALRSLADASYARLDETVGKLDDLVPDQHVRLSAVIVVEVQPRVPNDQASIDTRRYAAPNEVFWDEIQIGKVVYRATVGKFISEYLLSINVSDYSVKPMEERPVCSQIAYPTMKQAWDWFDEYIEQERVNVQVSEQLHTPRRGSIAGLNLSTGASVDRFDVIEIPEDKPEEGGEPGEAE